MEKYCKSCGRVFDELKFQLCPYCGGELGTRYGRQPIPRELRHEIFKRDGYRCRECGATKDETSLEIDHIIPVARGGTNDINNLQTLCRECNRMKHTDSWVGGELDSTQIENQIKLKNDEKTRFEQSLTNLYSENEIIDCKYKIMKLEEEINLLHEKLVDVKNHENKNFEIQKKIEEREKRYKRMYVSMSDTEFDDWMERTRDNHFKTKDQLINYVVDVADPDFHQALDYFNNQEYKEALKIFDSLVNVSKSEVVWIQKGLCHSYLNQDDERVKCYNMGLKINPLNVGILYIFAASNYDSRDYQDALNYCNKILEIDPQHNNALTLKHNVNLNLALLSNNHYEREELLKDSKIWIDKSLKENPNDGELWFQKARIHNAYGEYKNMIKCYNKCIKFNPDADGAWFNKGLYYMNEGENSSEALNCFNKAIIINPNEAKYFENKGYCLERRHNITQAKVAFKKALQLDPSKTYLQNKI